MWWLDEESSTEVLSERAITLARELEAETQRRLAAEARLEETGSQYAEQLDALQQTRRNGEAALQESESRREAETQLLRSELESLQKLLAETDLARSDLEAALAQRDVSHAGELVALTQTRCEAEASLRESEARRERGIATLQSKLQLLQQTLAEFEAARGEVRIASLRRDERRSQQSALSEQARESAEARAVESAARLMSLEQEVVTLKSRLEVEIGNRVAVDVELKQCRESHAAELDSLHTQIRSLQQSVDAHEAARRNFEAATKQHEAKYALVVAEAAQTQEVAEQRANELADRLAAMELERASLQVNLATELQGRMIAEAGWRDFERQSADETDSLRSRLLKCDKLARDHEAERHESESALTQLIRQHAAELAESNTTRQAAERRGEELVRQLRVLERQLDSSSAWADVESESRVAAEAELQQLRFKFRRLRSEADKTHRNYRDLQRQSAEQREDLTSEAAKLRLEIEDRERQLRERDERLAGQLSELEVWQESERRIRLEMEQLSTQHAKRIASLETQLDDLRSLAEAEQASRIRVEREAQQRVEELSRQLTEETHQRLLSQSQVTALQMELAQRHDELNQSHAALTAAMHTQQAERKRVEEQREAYQAVQREVAALRLSAAESSARNAGQLAETRTAMATLASQLAAGREQIKRLQHQLQEAIQRNDDEQESRQRAEALAEPLAEEVGVLRKRAEAFRGLAQREAAARKQLESAIKRAGTGTHGDASLFVIRGKIEVNERIRRLTTELTAAQNQMLSDRQRAMQEIKRAHEEVQQLKDQLAKQQKAA